MRVVTKTYAEDLQILADTAVPPAGMDLSASLEGILLLELNNAAGTWSITVQAGDGTGNWFEIKDAFGTSTARAVSSVANAQKFVWQLANFGQNVRVYFDGSGADQDLTIVTMRFLGKA